jgi:fibronectin type 3 domain-containing protein
MKMSRTTWVLVALVAATIAVFAYGHAKSKPGTSVHTVRLHWKASRGATSYNVYRGTVSGGPYKKIGHSSTPSYVDSSPPSHIVLYYVVTAVRGKQESEYSAEIKAKIP